MKRKVLLAILALAAAFIVFTIACERHKDPFSAKNTAPRIISFVFKPDPNLPAIRPDSLRYRPVTSYALHLEYEDAEFRDSDTKTLQARFRFINGSGKISHDQFRKPGAEADVLKFAEVPAKFNGDLLFTPDASGRVRLELVLSDGVRDSEPAPASVVFFENLAPVPSFTARALTQVNPYRIEFNPERSQDRDGDITQAKFIWSFGDNSKPDTVLGRSIITHEYVLAGQYRVRLRIEDDEGKANSIEQLVTTNNQAPVAALRVTPQSGQAPLEIDYNAGGSFDPDGTIASYEISFDDGATAQNVAGKHTYTRDGNYRVLLIVKDNLGLADTTIRPVQVATPPAAKLTVTPRQGSFPLRCTIDASESKDPFGGELSYQIFIDGQLRYTQPKVTHFFDIPKTTAYLVRLEVESLRNGLRANANADVLVTNTPPVANFTFTPSNPQATVEIRFTSTSSDPDSTDTITNYRWIWDDGKEDAGGNLRSITHRYDVSRTYLVKLIVTDRFNATGEKEIPVKVE
jgi:PKD repeat protein